MEVPLEGDEGVAGGGGDVLGVDFGFLGWRLMLGNEMPYLCAVQRLSRCESFLS